MENNKNSPRYYAENIVNKTRELWKEELKSVPVEYRKITIKHAVNAMIKGNKHG